MDLEVSIQLITDLYIKKMLFNTSLLLKNNLDIFPKVIIISSEKKKKEIIKDRN